MSSTRAQEILDLMPSLGLSTSPSCRAQAQSRITSLLSPANAFPELWVDPYTISYGHRHNKRQYSDTSIREAVDSIYAITFLLKTKALDRESGAALLPAIMLCVRRLWDPLVHWLEFLHPREENVVPSLDVVEAVATALMSFSVAKSHMSSLLEQTPQLYRLFMDLWLHFPAYTGTVQCFDPDTTEIFRDMSAIVLCTTLVTRPVSRDLDTTAVREALAAVKGRTRRLYRSAVECLWYCRDDRGDFNPEVVNGHLNAILFLVEDAMPIRLYPRDVVLSVVQLIYKTESHPLDTQTPLAMLACKLLHRIWSTADDNRSLIWALKAGVLPLMMSLNKKLGDYDVSRAVMFALERSVFLPVARTLGGLENQSCFKQSELGEELDPNGFTEGELELRFRIMRDLSDALKICANDQCERKQPFDESARVRVCPCFRARYCSAGCQRAHWAQHGLKCSCWTLPVFHCDYGNLRPLELHFAGIIGLYYLQRFVLHILEEFGAHAREQPSVGYGQKIIINCRQHVLPGYELEFVKTQAGARAGWVKVIMVLGGAPGNVFTISWGYRSVDAFRDAFVFDEALE
ncbi:hypothetical protein GGG16DRAFT_48142 [Schizophyllum commune]